MIRDSIDEIHDQQEELASVRRRVELVTDTFRRIGLLRQLPEPVSTEEVETN